MEEIIRITINGTPPDFCLVGEAYEDKIVITPDSISYEYKPDPLSKLVTNIHRKWSYKTTSPIFKELYKRVAEMTPRFLHSEDTLLLLDASIIKITATYKDKHKESVEYHADGEFFADYFCLIKEMVPSCEYVPAVLLTDEDFSDNEV